MNNGRRRPFPNESESERGNNYDGSSLVRLFFRLLVRFTKQDSSRYVRAVFPKYRVTMEGRKKSMIVINICYYKSERMISFN